MAQVISITRDRKTEDIITQAELEDLESLLMIRAEADASFMRANAKILNRLEAGAECAPGSRSYHSNLGIISKAS